MKNNNLPNFLIVGAAKSGTTSLHHYLNSFDDIFLPEPKEPKYISSSFLKFPFKGPGDQVTEKAIIKNFDEYNALFQVRQEISAIGDASADNLYYYEQAIPVIKELLGDPKIIIILRNPTDRAFSAYMHMRRELREKLSFKEALYSEESRIAKNFEFIWHYKNAGMYYKQVMAYQEAFSNTKVFLFEELKSRPYEVINSCREFLDLPHKNYDTKVQNFNKSGEPRYPVIKKLFLETEFLRRKFKHLIPNKYRSLIKSKIFSIDKRKIEIEDKSFLDDYFFNDIKNLQTIIDKDVSTWMK